MTGRSLRPSGALVIGLTATGRLDRRFGDANGVTRFSVYGSQEGTVVGTSAGSVAVDPQGRYVVEVTVFRGIGAPAENGVARLLPDGRLDSSYYDGGYHTEVTYGPRGGDVVGDGLALQPDGSVVSGGGVAGRFALLGYDADGAPGGLLATTDLAAGQDERSTAVTLDSGGGVLSVGYTGRRVGVVRYVDGRPDTTFAEHGKAGEGTARLPADTRLRRCRRPSRPCGRGRHGDATRLPPHAGHPRHATHDLRTPRQTLARLTGCRPQVGGRGTLLEPWTSASGHETCHEDPSGRSSN